MSKTSQWIANSLFILSCLFLPWKNLEGPFGGHTASEGHFTGYYLLLSQPEGLALDSLLFMLQLILIGAIILWAETLIRSSLDKSEGKYIGITLAIASMVVLFPPIGEVSLIPNSFGEVQDVVTGMGFLVSDSSNVIPKYMVIELIALFGLSTLAMKYHSRRIAARPMPVVIEEATEIQSQASVEDANGHWTDESIRFA